MTTNTTVVELTKENFTKLVNNHPFAVVDFWAPWCGPCRSFAPVFADAAQKHPDALFAKVNTQDEQELAAHFNIRSIPTLMILRDNIIVFSEAGALAASALEQVLGSAQALDMQEVRREIDTQAQTDEPNAAA
jgi:thioredoxin 1